MKRAHRPHRSIFHSPSPKATRAIARCFAKTLTEGQPRKQATVVALEGSLGSGKTLFVQACGKALGIRGTMTSPTFLIMRRYPFRGGRFANLFHVDAYRIRSPREMQSLHFWEAVAEPRNVILVEWARRLQPLLPRRTIWVHLSHGKTPRERILRFSSRST